MIKQKQIASPFLWKNRIIFKKYQGHAGQHVTCTECDELIFRIFLQMNQRLGQIALLVDDYDKALEFYTKKLNFKLIEDTPLSETKRWVVVEPSGGESGARLLLAKADSDEQRTRIGNQTGGRVFLFLYTTNCLKDHAHLVSQGIKIVRGPDVTPYGTVLVFEDLYGNQWDLIERSNK